MDGTVYEVISVSDTVLLGGVDQMRVTSVAGGVNGLSACSSSGAGAMQQTSAAAGASAFVGQALYPMSATIRSGVLTPNDLETVSFDPNNGGRLTIGSGAGAITICRDPIDCLGAPNVASTFLMSQGGGGVPPACLALSVTSACLGQTEVQTFAFGLAATGNPPVCETAPTTTTSVCAAPPQDGFTIGRGQFIVFLYNHNLSMSGFTTAASGFGIDLDDGAICAANQVITADGQAPSAPPVAGVTPSPTPSPTPTASASPTPTSPPTLSPTPTPTPPPTFSPIPTASATITATPCPVEICTDNIDNDCDELIDCDDTISCPCQPLARDPAHLCPNGRGLHRYTIHARVFPVTEVADIETRGLVVTLMYHGTVPWESFHLRADELRIQQVGRRGVRYRYINRSSGPGIKKFTVRKIWIHGELAYLINGRGLVSTPPLPGRYDILQQITIGDTPFVTNHLWQRQHRCLVLRDYRPPR